LSLNFPFANDPGATGPGTSVAWPEYGHANQKRLFAVPGRVKSENVPLGINPVVGTPWALYKRYSAGRESLAFGKNIVNLEDQLYWSFVTGTGRIRDFDLIVRGL
jgi:hypothetical protein